MTVKMRPLEIRLNTPCECSPEHHRQDPIKRTPGARVRYTLCENCAAVWVTRLHAVAVAA